MEERKLRMSENKVQMRIFVSKREEGGKYYGMRNFIIHTFHVIFSIK
jgi:hypothetical protein